MELLPLPTTYAVMVHRRYLDRVRDAMLPEKLEWTHVNNPSNKLESKKRRRSEDDECITVGAPDVSGGRKERQGYSLLICRSSLLRPPQDLHAITRMNISWATKLSRMARNTGDVNDENDQILHSVAASTFDELRKLRWMESKDTHKLRVDTFPKEKSEKLCRLLQRHAQKHIMEMNGSNELIENSLDDPFSGPIQFTRSASQCTHVLSFVRASSSRGYYGLWSRKAHFSALNNLFNHNAKPEVIIEPSDSATGSDLNTGSNGGGLMASDIPVSRAYYKLSQLVDDYLSKDKYFLARGSGLDLGASPGGWTQVLKFQVGCEIVAAVDPGCLAKRVEKAPGVFHVRSDLAKRDAIISLSKHSPYSCVVCDASLNNFEVVDKLCEMFEELARVLQEDTSSEEYSNALTLPAVIVVTLKFPYKTSSSIKKNLGLVLHKIPSALQRISEAAYGEDRQDNVDISYKILHLMANSESERTLIAKFDRFV